jgi:hypothetical protein
MAENLRLIYEEENENEFSSFVSELREISEDYERTDLLVIRARLYLEFIIDKLIEARMEGINSVDDEYESFNEKFTILNKLYQVNADVNNNLQKINEMRNVYAHNLDLEEANARVVEKSADLRPINDSAFEDLNFPNSKRDNIVSKTISTFIELASMHIEVAEILETEGFTVVYDEI